jgi:glycosyltransferase involved in cell wall biosynthesis
VKIFIPMHVFNNFGGIINHNEQLIAGLKDLGHEVTFAYIKPTHTAPKPVDVSTCPEGYVMGAGTGYPVHQGKGWIAPYYSLKNNDSIKKFVEDANKHDIVIWQSVFGFKNAETEKYTDWIPMIEDVNAKQVVVVHDGNLKKLYSWIHKFSHKFSGLACVHPAAYKSADFMPVPRNMILNPQDLTVLPTPGEWENRKNVVLSLQTFKRWKRVDDLVFAVPYIQDSKVIVAGDGMERAYMTSPDKCKPEYHCNREKDPDATEDMLGKKIWDNAMDTGNMAYIGFISEQKRDKILESSKFLIDTSWTTTYGEHFNRVIVDAMRVGVVPIARNLGVSDHEHGNGTLFKVDENYLVIPSDATPKQFGDYINWYMNISKEKYDKIVQNNYEVLKLFDRKVIAQQYIDLAMGKDAGYYEKNEVGSLATSPKAVSTGNKLWEDHFEVANVAVLDEFFG